MKDMKVRERDGARYLEGYFAVFDKEYRVWDDWIETIAPGAFANTLASGRDVKALWSDEDALTPQLSEAERQELPEGRRAMPGSVSFVPSVAGLMIAGQVIREMCGDFAK